MFSGVVPPEQANQDLPVGRERTRLHPGSVRGVWQGRVPSEARGGAAGEGDEQGMEAAAVGWGDAHVSLRRQHGGQAVQVFGLLHDGHLLDVPQLLCGVV